MQEVHNLKKKVTTYPDLKDPSCFPQIMAKEIRIARRKTIHLIIWPHIQSRFPDRNIDFYRWWSTYQQNIDYYGTKGTEIVSKASENIVDNLEITFREMSGDNSD